MTADASSFDGGFASLRLTEIEEKLPIEGPSS
jgi:hypothetical protein